MKLTRKERAALIPNDLDLVLTDRAGLLQRLAGMRLDVLKNGNVLRRLKKFRRDLVVLKCMPGRVGGVRVWGHKIYTREEYEKRKARGEPV